MLDSDDEEMIELAIEILKNDASPYLGEFTQHYGYDEYSYTRSKSVFPLKFRADSYYGNWLVRIHIISITVKKIEDVRTDVR